jgi:hypothetical protein
VPDAAAMCFNALPMRVAGAACCALGVCCSASLPRPTYTAQPTSALVEVDQPPPPARVELLPLQPDKVAVWLDGQWIWRRGRWAWMPGRWTTTPAGARYAPWEFVRGPDGRLWYAEGVWRDAQGNALAPTVPLGVASVEAGEVVTAEGVAATTGPTLRPSRLGPSQPAVSPPPLKPPP